MSLVESRPRDTAFFYLTASLLWAAMYIYVPILPVHAERLGASMGLVGTIVGAYGFSQLVLRVPMGIWSDRMGRRKPVMLVGIVAAGVGGLVLGLASDPAWLVAGRAMAGIGAASWVAFTVLISTYYAPEDAPRAMTYVVFATGVSQTVCSLAGGAIAEVWGWNAPFFVAIGLAMAALLTGLSLREKPAVIHRSTSPGELYRLATNPGLLALATVTLLSLWSTTATSGGFSLVFAARLGASRGELGVLSTVVQLAFMLITLGSDRVARRIGYRSTVAIGMVAQSIGALMVPWVDTLPWLAFSQALSGLGRGFSYSILMGLSIRGIEVKDRATAMGVFQAIYALGMFAGPATTGMLGDALGFFSVFNIAGAATLIGLALTVARVPKK